MQTRMEAAPSFRYRSGNVELAIYPTHASYPIVPGDLVFVSSGVAYPASAMADQSTPTANYTAFALAFVGVALGGDGLLTTANSVTAAGGTPSMSQHSFELTTRKGYVLVATSGDFEMDCASYAWKPGQMVSACEVSSGSNSGTQLEDSKVVVTTLEYHCIGIAKVNVNSIIKATPGTNTATTKVIVSLRSQAFKQDVGSGQG